MAPTPETDKALLVIIDHQQAKVFHTGSPDPVAERIVPDEPQGLAAQGSSAHEWTDGKRLPDRKSYYEAVARSMAEAGRIVVFGNGTEHCTALDELVAELKAHHPKVAARIIAMAIVDAHQTPEQHLLAEARNVFARFEDPPTTSPS